MPGSRSLPQVRHHIWGLLALFFLIRLSAFLWSKNFAYDAVIRTEIAQAWAKSFFFIPPPQLNLPPQYCPLPIYLYGLGLKLVDNPHIVPRLISLFFATLTLVPFYFLVEILYDSRKAVIASLFLCAYTLSIENAVVASSESIFCFFLLMAIWRLYTYKSNRRQLDLLLAVIFMNLTAMSRYNGWLYIPLLMVMVPDNWQEDISGMLYFGMGSVLFPLVWMVACWRVYGDFLYPIHFILADHMMVIAQSGSVWLSWPNKLYLLLFWPGVLFLSLTPPVAYLAVMGIAHAGRVRWGMHPLILAVVPSAFILFRMLISETFFPMTRFVTDSGIFLLVYAAWGYERIENRWRVKQKRGLRIVVGGFVSLSIVALAVVGLVDIPSISSKIRSVSPLVRLDPTQERISSYLKQHMTNHDKVVLDSYRSWSQVEIIFYSGHRRSRFLTRWRRQSQLTGWIRKNRPRFLVTGPGGRGWDVVENERLWAQTGFKPVLIYKAGRQNIYRFEKITKNITGIGTQPVI